MLFNSNNARSLLHAHQENLKSLAYRTLILNRPHIARNAADQNFPLQFTQVHDPPEQYLLHRESYGEPPPAIEEGEEEIPDERVSYVIFGRWHMFERMCAAEVVYIDGTFKICPLPYKQYFTIHIFIGKRKLSVFMCPIIISLILF